MGVGGSDSATDERRRCRPFEALRMTSSLLIAALGGLLWAVVIILDRIAVLNIFRHYLQALIITAILGTWGFLLLPFVQPALPPLAAGLWAFAGGTALWASYAVYYRAMAESDDSSEVAAWDAAYPLMVALLLIPAGNAIGMSSFAGVLCICVGLALFQWHRGVPTPQSVSLGVYRALLGTNMLLNALAYVCMSIALQTAEYWDVYFFFLAGTSGGVLMLAYRPVRTAFRQTWRLLLPYWWLFALMEVVNVLAPLCITYAFRGVHPAVATALGATFPIYIVVLSPVLRRLGATETQFPRIDRPWLRVLPLLVLAVGVALLGTDA